MDFVVELWKPIVFSGLAVFILSALFWTVLPFHNKEWGGLANEDAVADALRAGNPSPGLYILPHASDPKAMGTPEMQAKLNRGPNVFLTVTPNGVRSMGPMMVKSVIFNILVSVFVAYVAVLALPSGAEYLQVFRVTSAVGFMAYAFGTVPDSIWFGKPWSSWALQAGDALVFGLVIGGFFGWLWP